MELLVLNSNTWNNLTVCKQIISIKSYCNTWQIGLLMLNNNTRNCVQIELLVFESNTWNHLTMYKDMCPD